MKVKIVIENPDDVKNFRLKVKSLKIQLLQFQAITIRKLANQILVDTIQRKMRDAKYSEKIVINTVLSDLKFISKRKVRLFFKSELFTETGFDIALVREKTGTRDHMDKPSIKKALRWISTGKVIFSKGHEVSGIKALHIIANTLDELTPAVQLQYESSLQNWISRNLGGEAVAI